MNYLTFPFGKYKGVELERLPTSYIAWVLDNVELTPQLQEDLITVFLDRYAPQLGAITMPEHSLVKSLYRSLCKKYHPDHGGSVEAMQALNEFYQILSDHI